MSSIELVILKNKFIFDYRKSIFWTNNKILIISDTHFGKGYSFRLSGIPVPTGSSLEIIKILIELIVEYQPEYLFFLGDFLHSNTSLSKELIQKLIKIRKDFKKNKFYLLKGNHDKNLDLIKEINFFDEIKDLVVIDDFGFSHYYEESTKFSFSGHIHPAIKLKDNLDYIKLECFYITDKYCILPAFGKFTGNKIIYPRKKDQAIIIFDSQLRLINY